MCSPVSGASAVHQSHAAQSAAAPKATPSTPSSQAPDSVKLSATALAALGDADGQSDSQ